MNIKSVIKSLSTKRPIFHSEHDFKFALAWEIQSFYPSSKVRLEVPCNGGKIDILVIYKNHSYPIELKYKKLKLDITIDEEKFSLSKDGAHTDNVPKFINDIYRVENNSETLNGGMRLGFTIWLTNDHIYWNGPQKPDVDHAPFFVHEGVEIKGKIGGLSFKGSYTIHWDDYHDLKIKKGQFRYALTEIC